MLLAGCSFDLVDASSPGRQSYLNIFWVVADTGAVLAAEASGGTDAQGSPRPTDRRLQVNGVEIEPSAERGVGISSYRLLEARGATVHIQAPAYEGLTMTPSLLVQALTLDVPDTLRISRSDAVADVAITGTQVQSGGPGVQMSAGFNVDRVTGSWQLGVRSAGGTQLIHVRGWTVPGSLVIPTSQLPAHVTSGHVEMELSVSQQLEALSGYEVTVLRRTSVQVPFTVVP